MSRTPVAPASSARLTQDQADAGLGRPEAAVAEREDAEHLGLEVGVDRQREVGDDDRQAGGEAHVGRQPEPDADGDRGAGVDEVVEVVAVLRPLDAPYAGERAVERVAQPVDDEQAAGDPQPRRVAPAQPVGGADPQRGEHAEHGHVVRHHPRRHALGEPVEHAALGGREQERLLSWCVGHRQAPC